MGKFVLMAEDFCDDEHYIHAAANSSRFLRSHTPHRKWIVLHPL